MEGPGHETAECSACGCAGSEDCQLSALADASRRQEQGRLLQRVRVLRERVARHGTALRRHAIENDIGAAEESEFGVRYVVDGPMPAPDGTLLNVRSVWYVDADGDAPRFVTAHPLRRKSP